MLDFVMWIFVGPCLVVSISIYKRLMHFFFFLYYECKLCYLLILIFTILVILNFHFLSFPLANTSNIFIFPFHFLPKVAGDCTYFDCNRIPLILKEEMLTNVPIGLPITNCKVVLIGENSASNEGELYVGGSCIFRGYFNESDIMSDGFVKLPQSYGCEDSVDACQSELYFRTGDFVKQLPSGDFIFLGRKDRIVKVNGQRIALEEVENLLREHPHINDAAVVCRNLQSELVLIEAFVILKDKQQLGELLVPAIRSWMLNKLPLVVLPNRFIFIESFPMSFSGKINYEILVSSALLTTNVKDKVGNISCNNLLQLIKKVWFQYFKWQDTLSICTRYDILCFVHILILKDIFVRQCLRAINHFWAIFYFRMTNLLVSLFKYFQACSFCLHICNFLFLLLYIGLSFCLPIFYQIISFFFIKQLVSALNMAFF